MKNLKLDNHSFHAELREMLFDLVIFGETKLLIMALEKCDQVSLNYQDDNGYNLLHLAIFRKNTEMVKMLLGKDISINAQTKTGNTPLIMILILGSAPVNERRLSIEVVRELMNECLAKNPDLNLTNAKGESVVSLINELYPNDPQLSMMLECHRKKHPDEERPKPESPK